MARLANIHPGKILREEFLEPLDMTPYRLAKSIGVQQSRIEAILDGKRSITADTAIRLGRFFNMTPQFWLNLQDMYDLEEQELKPDTAHPYDQIHAYNETPAVFAG